jgi:hypothetical protein
MTYPAMCLAPFLVMLVSCNIKSDSAKSGDAELQVHVILHYELLSPYKEFKKEKF